MALPLASGLVLLGAGSASAGWSRSMLLPDASVTSAVFGPLGQLSVSYSSQGGVMLRERPHAGHFGRAVPVPQSGEIVFTRSGALVMLLSQSVAPPPGSDQYCCDGHLASVRRAGKSRFSMPQSFGDLEDGGTVDRLAALADGEVLAAVSPDGSEGTFAHAFWRLLPPGGTLFGSGSEFGRPDQRVLAVQVAADRAGGVFAAWLRDWHVWVSYRPPHGQFRAPVRVSGREDVYDTANLQIAAGGDGRAVIGWITDKGRPTTRMIRKTRLYRRAQILSAPGDIATYLTVGMDARGGAVAAWEEERDGVNVQTGELRTAISDGDELLPAGRYRIKDALVVTPSLAVAPNGDSVVAWTASSTSHSGPTVQAVPRRGTANHFGKRRRLSSGHNEPSEVFTAAGPRGEAAVIWNQDTCDTCPNGPGSLVADIFNFDR